MISKDNGIGSFCIGRILTTPNYTELPSKSSIKKVIRKISKLEK